MKVIDILLLINYILVFLFILGMIIKADKKPVRIFAWTIVLMIPFFGLICYVYIGKGISAKTKFMLKKRKIKIEEYEKLLQKEALEFRNGTFKTVEDNNKDLIMLNLNNASSLFSTNNKVKIFTNGKEMLDHLMQDIKNASKSINIMFYIFANDKTGKEMRNLLIEKAQQGVKVKVIYDAVGSFKTSKFFFRKLVKAGGEVEEFFPPFLGIKVLNVYANYRNHRKIVVIDGKIGYTGGMNIRDDHMGLHKKLKPWRDTHLKIEGSCVYSLQNIFISDWRFVNKKYLPTNLYVNDTYYADVNENQIQNGIGMQVVASSPETINEPIKECMIKMITKAKSIIRIQTPYFILDDTFKGALILALLSGVKVEIMVPSLADHKTVWYASLSYLQDIEKYGAKIYFYKGFLHSKTLSVDDEIVTIGSSNVDLRSFSLNFEANVVLYGNDITNEHNNIFNEDIKHCELIDQSYFKQIPFIKKMFMRFCRLFSAIF